MVFNFLLLFLVILSGRCFHPSKIFEVFGLIWREDTITNNKYVEHPQAQSLVTDEAIAEYLKTPHF